LELYIEHRTLATPEGEAFAAVPEDIKTFDHWVVHRDKEPYNARTGARASTTDSRTWSSFGDALAALLTGNWDGIGFVFSSSDPFVGIDFDACRDPETGVVDENVMRFVKSFSNYYAEVSPSGTGIHVIVVGKLREGKRKGGIEMYGQERFFTVTGEELQ